MTLIEEKKQKVDDAWMAYRQAQNELNEEIVKDFLDKWSDEYVKIETGDNSPFYMLVDDIWGSGENKLHLEGKGFTYNFSEYADDTFFKWDAYTQITVFIDDLTSDNPSAKIVVITEEEYKNAFKEVIKKIW